MIGYSRPTPAQVRELAMIGGTSARERRALRRQSMRGQDDFYAVDRMYEFVDTDDQEGRIVRHTLGMLLGRISLSQAAGSGEGWRLIYSDGNHTEDGSQTNTVYTFEWSKDHVYRATRHSYIVDKLGDTRESLPLSDVAPDLSVRDDRESMITLGLEADYAQVTAEDCMLLSASLQRYYASLRNDVPRNDDIEARKRS